ELQTELGRRVHEQPPSRELEQGPVARAPVARIVRGTGLAVAADDRYAEGGARAEERQLHSRSSLRLLDEPDSWKGKPAVITTVEPCSATPLRRTASHPYSASDESEISTPSSSTGRTPHTAASCRYVEGSVVTAKTGTEGR